MSYSDSPSTNWGCIVAGAFLFLLGLPMLFGTMLGDVCVNPNGCMDKRLAVLIVAAIVGFGSFAIMRLVNIVTRNSHEKE